MVTKDVIAELERQQCNGRGEFFNTLFLVFVFALVIAGLIFLIRAIWTGINFLVEFGLDRFWEWKNADIENYSQRRYDAFKKKQFEEWKNKMNK